MTGMAEIVLKGLQEATELICKSCTENERLKTVLALALESATQLVADTRNI